MNELSHSPSEFFGLFQALLVCGFAIGLVLVTTLLAVRELANSRPRPVAQRIERRHV